jgi:hypothetical protein
MANTESSRNVERSEQIDTLDEATRRITQGCGALRLLAYHKHSVYLFWTRESTDSGDTAPEISSDSAMVEGQADSLDRLVTVSRRVNDAPRYHTQNPVQPNTFYGTSKSCALSCRLEWYRPVFIFSQLNCLLDWLRTLASIHRHFETQRSISRRNCFDLRLV